MNTAMGLLSMAHWAGVSIVVSEHAVTRVCKVERMPIRKRRKAYRVRPHLVPAVWQMGSGFGGKLVMHPTVYEQLRNVTAAA